MVRCAEHASSAPRVAGYIHTRCRNEGVIRALQNTALAALHIKQAPAWCANADLALCSPGLQWCDDHFQATVTKIAHGRACVWLFMKSCNTLGLRSCAAE